VIARLGAWLYAARSWTAVPFVIALLIAARPSPPLLAIGLIVVACGEALRVAGLRYLAPSARSGRLHADALATGGPYRFVRNPVYLGNVLLVAGFILSAGIGRPAFLAVAAAALAIQYSGIIASEEAFLSARFPEAFARYRARVPCLVPLRAPYGDKSPPLRGAREVLRAEYRTLHTLALLLALIAFKGLIT
jgi:steroid 5-alpha reductase family enzyme